MNQDGEGMDDLQKFARKKGVAMGLIEPNEQEKAEMMAEQQQKQQQPDPMAMVAGAQAQALGAQAQKDMAQAGKVTADTDLSKAKTADTLASAGKKRAETQEIRERPPEPPTIPPMHAGPKPPPPGQPKFTGTTGPQQSPL